MTASLVHRMPVVKVVRTTWFYLHQTFSYSSNLVNVKGRESGPHQMVSNVFLSDISRTPLVLGKSPCAYVKIEFLSYRVEVKFTNDYSRLQLRNFEKKCLLSVRSFRENFVKVASLAQHSAFKSTTTGVLTSPRIHERVEIETSRPRW